MKKSILILPIALLVWNIGHAQQKVNYIEIRKDLVKSTCTTTDAEINKQDLANLLALDITNISKGLSEYYYDLGMLYYACFGNKEGQIHLHAYACMKRCVELDKKNGSAYLNLSIMYYFDKNMPLAKEYALLHKKYTRKKYRDNEFLSRIEQK